VPAEAPEGLCPRCLGALNLDPDSALEGQKVFSEPAPTLPALAPQFPELEIVDVIGKGGMGAVYKARQRELDRFVALKILPPGIGRDPAFADRFTREAKALARLNHPGIVTLYEFGHTPEGLYYFLMEFVDGVNLRKLLNAGRVSPREALAIVPQICDALQYAHDQGIIHRDIKPENVLLGRQGRVKVADFGLAKLVNTEGGSAPVVDGRSLIGLPEAGNVMGTPQYMAPEQREHPTKVDHRADIYSLGIVFYEMLTGELPGKPIEAPSRKVRLDVRVDAIVMRALDKIPELRYETVTDFCTEIQTITTDGGSLGTPASQKDGSVPPHPKSDDKCPTPPDAECLPTKTSIIPVSPLKLHTVLLLIGGLLGFSLIIVAGFGWLRREPVKGAHLQGAVVGPAGYTNDFKMQPPATDWATFARPGGPSDVYDMDTDVNAQITAAVVSTRTTALAADPPPTDTLATWSSTGFYLQTRPKSIRYIALMGKFVNNTGTNATQARLSYRYTLTGDGPPEDSGKGTRVYCSVTGELNSWTNIPVLNYTANRNVSLIMTASFGINWPNGGSLYLLWVDDNSREVGDDAANQIHNFSLQVTGGVGPSVPTN